MQTGAAPGKSINFDQRLKDLDITLPALSKPAASYVPYVVSGNQVFISGQLPLGVGELSEHVGKLGSNFSIEQGKATARVCGLNVIAQLRDALGGSLKGVRRCVKLGVFVNSTDSFVDHPQVANGASDLMAEVFGEFGAHSRFAVGATQLPRGVAVEVEAIFEIA